MTGTTRDTADASRRVIVLGAGPMGLAAAYEAVKRGYQVDVLEAGDVPGGMAAHFDFDGLSIERFYHFCCLSDTHTLALLDELGLGDAMQWVTTRMGFHLEGRLIDWGHPVALLKAPGIDLLTKLRYGLLAFTSTRRSRWQHLDAISAERWITHWIGEKAYDRLWRPLMALKFHEYADKVSAAWIWQRMKRLGNSRASLFEERLGYIEGGSETLINALVKAITERGGRIHCGASATRFLIRDADTKFSASFDTVWASEAARVIQIPHRAPNVNAFAESFIGTIKRECLDFFVCFSRSQLDYILRTWVRHYNVERPHRGREIGNNVLQVDFSPARDGPIRRRRQLGGIITSYTRDAA